jgi:hypothetical protein
MGTGLCENVPSIFGPTYWFWEDYRSHHHLLIQPLVPNLLAREEERGGRNDRILEIENDTP